ncbi:MAG: hypothetical protein HC887_04140 [Desulfobacteraceae bacterium]|nr:hypothetical protein [Desulfobacteraceae bacterium]
MLNMMDQNNFFKQLADYQMTVMNSSFNAMNIFQNRNEKAMELLVNQMNWATEKWKGSVSDLGKAYQDGFEKFRK